MALLMLNDEHWSKLKSILLEDRVDDKPEHRKTLECILYRLRIGCAWRDLPKYFERSNNVYRRFIIWSRKGLLLRLFRAPSKDSDCEWEFNGSYIKAHQHNAGAASECNQGIGLSHGGIYPLNLSSQAVTFMTAKWQVRLSISYHKVNLSLQIKVMLVSR